MKWPPRSGRTIMAPELDRIAYFGVGEARMVMVASQLPVLEEAVRRESLGPSSPVPSS